MKKPAIISYFNRKYLRKTMYIHTPDGYTPNVLHFHGQNRDQLAGTFQTIFNNHLVNGDFDRNQLKVISTWTDEEKCWLLQQCRKANIPITNCVPDSYDRTQEWYMPNKIKFIIQELEKTEQEIVLFLDGYDVLLTHLDDIVQRFKEQKYRILFNPSCNNYPKVTIDLVYGRQNRGLYRYFNAGCVIGYTKDLLKFYKECEQYLSIKNPMNSEQYVIRFAYSNYSADKEQNFIGVDNRCDIFQSMGYLNTQFNDKEVIFWTKEEARKENENVLFISNLIGKELLPILQTIYNAEYIKLNSGLSQEFLDYIITSKLPKQIIVYTNLEELYALDKSVLERLLRTTELNEIVVMFISKEPIEPVQKYIEDNFKPKYVSFEQYDLENEAK